MCACGRAQECVCVCVCSCVMDSFIHSLNRHLSLVAGPSSSSHSAQASLVSRSMSSRIGKALPAFCFSEDGVSVPGHKRLDFPCFYLRLTSTFLGRRALSRSSQTLHLARMLGLVLKFYLFYIHAFCQIFILI